MDIMSVLNPLIYIFSSAAFIWLAINYFLFKQNREEVYVRDDSVPVKLEEVISGTEDKDTALLAPMSEFCAQLYKNNESTDQFGCWSKLQEREPKSVDFKDSRIIPGLKYSVWENSNEKIIAFVFRGTTSIIDFHSNLHFIFKHINLFKDQYEQLLEIIPPILYEHRDKLDNGYKVYSAGHSLGGGLAQYAVYQFPEITKAFVYNSSPVTGWSDVKEHDRKENIKGTKIIRVHENREILEFLRLLMKATYLFNPKPNRDPYVKEYRLNLRKGSCLAKHSIKRIALRFNRK